MRRGPPWAGMEWMERGRSRRHPERIL